MTRIGWIGTGLMGSRMAPHVLKAGYALTVWNRTADKSKELISLGATSAATPAALAGACDVVMLMVTNAHSAADILFNQGVARALTPGALVIDMSSIAPDNARIHAQRLHDVGIDHLDAPVSGGTRGAAAASLAIMVGGEKSAFDRALPILSCLGRPTYIGPASTGQIAKLANQVIVAVTIGAVAEALTLAGRAGANPAAVREALSGGFADSRILYEHGARMLAGDFTPGGTVKNQIKDLDAALTVAKSIGIELPMLQTTRAQFQTLADTLGDQLDHSALYRLWEVNAGN